MISYKDKTFCQLSDCPHFSTCDRALTEEVKKYAEAWWGNPNPPIAVVNTCMYGIYRHLESDG